MNSLIPLLVADLQKEDFDLEEEIESLAEQVGWSNVIKETMHVLDCPSKQSHWYQAASIVYWAVSEGRELPFPRKECLARLYYCLEVYPDLGHNDLSSGSNLVWSIATKLLTLSYESSWDPLSDDGITTCMSSIRAANA
jgi:hypothetical protein